MGEREQALLCKVPQHAQAVRTGTSPLLLLTSSPALGVTGCYFCWATAKEKGH